MPLFSPGQSWLLQPWAQQMVNPNGYTIDYRGLPVLPNQDLFLAGVAHYPTGQNSQIWEHNPQYNPNWTPPGTGTAPSSIGIGAPPPVSPQYQFVFDTIGQTIFRTLGHCRIPLRVIWAQGINASGDTTVSSTVSFAAALCAPIDPTESGSVSALYSGGTVIWDGSTVTPPPTMTTGTAALLTASLGSAIIYPGDEAQAPAPLIVADKGASVTNAFRGIRYIIFPSWPLDAGMPGNMSVVWNSTGTTSPGGGGADWEGAVEFAAAGG